VDADQRSDDFGNRVTITRTLHVNGDLSQIGKVEIRRGALFNDQFSGLPVHFPHCRCLAVKQMVNGGHRLAWGNHQFRLTDGGKARRGRGDTRGKQVF
jgi:hypothetical protein